MLTQVNISKIEALGSGSIYCQILDVIHPGKITLSKVNWKAKNDTEFLNNFRLLQSGFEKAGIKRYIEVWNLLKLGIKASKGQISGQLGVHSMVQKVF